MRSFAVAIVCLFGAACAAPAADAEADPALLYTNGAVLPYAGLTHAALPYAGVHHAAGYPYLSGVAPAVYTSAAVKSVVEKPAEVQVNAVAHPVVYGAHHAGVYGAGYPYAAYGAGYPYAAGYYANSGGAVHVVKREADAEADADADADAYYGSYGYGHGYRSYSPYSYGHGYRSYGAYPYGYRSAGYGYPYYG